MAVSAEELFEVLSVLTTEQRLQLVDQLAIPSWQPGTTQGDCSAGETVTVMLDRDVYLSGASTVECKNVTGSFIPTGSRVMVRKEGAILQIDGMLTGGTAFPPGILVAYGGPTEPSWGVFGTGQTVTCEGRYERLGLEWGIAPGASFTIPNTAGRVALFRNAETLRALGGSMTRTITQANIPVYDLPVDDPGHQHTQRATSTHIAAGGGADLLGMTFSGGNNGYTSQQTTLGATTGISVSSGGSGSAMDTTPAYVALNGVWTL